MGSSISSGNSIPSLLRGLKKPLKAEPPRSVRISPCLKKVVYVGKPWKKTEGWFLPEAWTSSRRRSRSGRNRMEDMPASSTARSRTSRLFILSVSPLRKDLNESDISDLFSTFGKINGVRVYYDHHCKSTGRADVLFAQKESAIRAYNAIKRWRLGGLKPKMVYRPQL